MSLTPRIGSQETLFSLFRLQRSICSLFKFVNSYTLYEAIKTGPCVAKDFFPADSLAATWDDVGLEDFGETLIEITQKLPGGKLKASFSSLVTDIQFYL